MRDYEQTIVSQYTSSPIICQLIEDLNEYIDPSTNLQNFYDLIWNVDTAIGYGLDVWGRIVGVNRVLAVDAAPFFGFAEAADSEGFNQAPFWDGNPATYNYSLTDEAYRRLIMAKAAANITDGSIPSINRILMALFPERGNAYVTDGPNTPSGSWFGFAEAGDSEGFDVEPFGDFAPALPDNMTMTYTFQFVLQDFELAIVTKSGVLPKSTGVLASVFSGTAAPIPTPSLYVPQAVHFDGLTWLLNAALVSSDNGTMSFSGWFRNATTPGFVPTIWVSNPVLAYCNYLTSGTTLDQTTMAVAAGLDLSNFFLSSNITVTPGVFYHIIGTVDTSSFPKATVYLTDVAVGQPFTAHGAPSGTIPFNGVPMYVGNDTFGAVQIGDMCDLWIAPGVSLLDGGGDIPLATRRKFINSAGKPVFLGLNGELPTGLPPAVFLSANVGDAASFANNRGSGGAFLTTGTLTLAAGP